MGGCTTHREPDVSKLDDVNRHFSNAAVFVNPGVRAAVPDVIDTQKERARLQRDLKKIDKELGAVEKKLENPSFVERAPAAVVAKSKRDAAELREKREQLEVALSRL